jgi:hypothetical protein
MTKNWLTILNVNPLEPLLQYPDDALTYFVRRDLLGEPVDPIETLWGLPEVDRLTTKQGPDGGWKYPFWWTNLLTALDTLYWLGFDIHDDDISKGLDWFIKNQAEDGLWETGYGSGQKAARARCWVGLAVCRMLSRYIN